MAGKVRVNGEEVKPSKKIKLTEHKTRKQIRELIEAKREPLKAKGGE